MVTFTAIVYSSADFMLYFSILISFTCLKSTTRDPQLYFPSEGSHTQDFYALKKFIDPGWVDKVCG